MERVLVTGASGFVARNLVGSLADKNFQLTLQSRSSESINHRHQKGTKLCTSSIDAIPSDIIEECDSVVHLACSGVNPKKTVDLERFFIANIQDPYNLFLKGLKMGAFKKIILVGSCFQYGRTAHEKGESLSVRDACFPLDQYAATKHAIESLALALPNYYQTTVISIRAFNLYGKYENEERLYPYLVSNASKKLVSSITKGNQVKYFTPVMKLVEKIEEKLLDQSLPRGFCIENLLGGCPSTVDQFARNIYKSYDLDPEKYILNDRPSRNNEPKCLLPNCAETGISVELDK